MKPLFAQFWKNRCSHLHTLVKRFQILTRQEVFKILNAHALWQSSPTWIYHPDALRGGPYIIIHLSTLLRAELIIVLAGCVPSGLQTLCHPSLNPNRTNCPTAGCPALNWTTYGTTQALIWSSAQGLSSWKDHTSDLIPVWVASPFLSVSVSSEAHLSLPCTCSPVISISLSFHKGWKKNRLHTASTSYPGTNLPCRGKEHQASLPTAGRVNTGRTEVTHLNSTYPDPFAKALLPAKVPRLPASIPGSGSGRGEQPLCHLCLCSGAHALYWHTSMKRG